MKRSLRRWRLAPALLALPLLLLATAGCVGYPAQGLVATPTAPGSTSQSRLPQLLSQLQGGSAGLELFDQQTNEVAAAQDEPGGSPTPGGKTVGSTATPTATQTGTTGTPTSLPLNPGTPTPPPAGDTPTPTPTAAPTETATPAPTEPPVEATPTPTIPTEGNPADQGPPTEGG